MCTAVEGTPPPPPPPWAEFLTHACENITFAQISSIFVSFTALE